MLEIFFDHSVLVNAALMPLYTVFLAALTMKTVYTPWVNAMSAAVYRNQLSEFWPLAIEKKKYRLIQKKLDFIQYSYFR